MLWVRPALYDSLYRTSSLSETSLLQQDRTFRIHCRLISDARRTMASSFSVMLFGERAFRRRSNESGVFAGFRGPQRKWASTKTPKS